MQNAQGDPKGFVFKFLACSEEKREELLYYNKRENKGDLIFIKQHKEKTKYTSYQNNIIKNLINSASTFKYANLKQESKKTCISLTQTQISTSIITC